MASKQRVLLVDDEREILAVLSEALEAHGFETATALDGEQALEQVSRFQPHAVILDVVMPKENGYRVCRRIKTGESVADGAPMPRGSMPIEVHVEGNIPQAVLALGTASRLMLDGQPYTAVSRDDVVDSSMKPNFPDLLQATPSEYLTSTPSNRPRM